MLYYFLSIGETGATPVRDRRRKVQTVAVLIRMPRSEDTPLEKILRRPDGNAPKSEYPEDAPPFDAADAPAWGKYHLRRKNR